MLPEIISKRIIQYAKPILFFIIIATLYFGYIAFLSDKKIVTDFSLEQLFPDKDPAKDLYEQLQFRQDLEQCEEHATEFIEQNIKFYKGRGLEISTPGQELENRLKEGKQRLDDVHNQKDMPEDFVSDLSTV